MVLCLKTNFHLGKNLERSRSLIIIMNLHLGIIRCQEPCVFNWISKNFINNNASDFNLKASENHWGINNQISTKKKTKQWHYHYKKLSYKHFHIIPMGDTL